MQLICNQQVGGSNPPCGSIRSISYPLSESVDDMTYHRLTATKMVVFFVSKGGKVMGIPQIIIVILYALNVGITLTKHGEPKEGNYNVFSTLIGTAISVGILWWGGFFG